MLLFFLQMFRFMFASRLFPANTGGNMVKASCKYIHNQILDCTALTRRTKKGHLGNTDRFLCQDAHQIGLRMKEAHSSSEGRKAVPIQQIKQVTEGPWSLRSMTVPSATLLIQYLRLQNKLPVKHRLPPLQGQPTVRHKLRWALRHATHRAKSFHNSALQSSTGENPASWIPNDDRGIPSEFWTTRDTGSGLRL